MTKKGNRKKGKTDWEGHKKGGERSQRGKSRLVATQQIVSCLLNIVIILLMIIVVIIMMIKITL